jgi:hypothetical protein
MGTTNLDTTGYGVVSRSVDDGDGDSWAAIRVGVPWPVMSGIVVGFECGFAAGLFLSLWRSIIVFDTSAIKGAITGATLRLTGTFDSSYAGTPAMAIGVYTATPADPESLVAADYSQCGTTPCSDTTIAHGDWLGGGNNDLALNAAGLAEIDTNGLTVFCLREVTYDVTGNAPSWENNKTASFGIEAVHSAHLIVTTTDSTQVIGDRTVIKQKPILELIRNVEVQLDGRFYVDKNGNAVYESRFHRSG